MLAHVSAQALNLDRYEMLSIKPVKKQKSAERNYREGTTDNTF